VYRQSLREFKTDYNKNKNKNNVNSALIGGSFGVQKCLLSSSVNAFCISCLTILYLVDYCTSVADVVSIYVPPVVVSSWCRVNVSARSAVGPSQWPVRCPGTHYRTVSASRHVMTTFQTTVSNIHWKHFLFNGYWRIERSRGVYDSALYKSTFTYLLIYLIPVDDFQTIFVRKTWLSPVSAVVCVHHCPSRYGEANRPLAIGSASKRTSDYLSLP